MIFVIVKEWTGGIRTGYDEHDLWGAKKLLGEWKKMRRIRGCYLRN